MLPADHRDIRTLVEFPAELDEVVHLVETEFRHVIVEHEGRPVAAIIPYIDHEVAFGA